MVLEAELGRGLPSSSPHKASTRKLKDSSSSFRDAETVSTECTTRTGSITDSPGKLLKSGISSIDISDEESVSIIDGIRETQNVARINSRFRRFGFGKSSANRQQGNKLDDARVSRPA